MIVSTCPLRISLVGGSTDHPKFLEKYGFGSVISFASNLMVYATVHQDVFGSNGIDNNYIINYSSRETVKNISDIKNELIRNCFELIGVGYVNCSLTSDVFSSGSGLASSSAYLMALIKSLYVLKSEDITEIEVCKKAMEIEKTFNPLVGQQDFYGSIGGLKKINFYKNKSPEITFLSTNIFNKMDYYLIYTGVLRNSTKVLESLDIDKSLILFDDVNDLESAINLCDVDSFNYIMKRSWINKKNTSAYICENNILKEFDDKLSGDENILSHKLCGAGNGGYFLIFTKLNKEDELKAAYNNIKKIKIAERGIKYINLGNGFTYL